MVRQLKVNKARDKVPNKWAKRFRRFLSSFVFCGNVREPDPEIFGKCVRKFRDQIFQGQSTKDVPPIELGKFEEETFASYAGPDSGLCVVCEGNSEQNGNEEKQEVAGSKSWSFKDQKAYGICISLYDQHPINGKMSGDPIADAFAVMARKNNAILLIADGFNWGEKSKLAARCALYGSMTHVHNQLFVEKNQPSTAQEALKILRKSIDEAHSVILEKNGGLTTLCACLVCPVANSEQYAVCSVNVGDSYAFIFSRHYGIREVTVGSHDVSSERDIRDAQGAIGPVIGNEPELNNLTCAFMPSPPNLHHTYTLAFAVMARKNNAILLIADGFNWGEKSKLAARCALYGSMTHDHNQLFVEKNQPSTAQEALKILRKSIDEAHSVILEKNGGLTTLCACLVCPVANSEQYAVCSVNVGDSYAFIFSRHYGIREVTVGSHDVSSERDIRDAQGAIGPVIGNEPELNNLTCAVSFANAGDVVFLTTDGISDNFDPVVTKVALPRRNSDPNLSLTRDTPLPSYAKPEMSPQERHVYSMKEMKRIVHEYKLMTEEDCSAQEICGAMVQHVLTLTDSKRKVLENPALYARKKMSSTERKRRDSEIVEKMSKAPGKLDHASLVAYEVGVYGQEEDVQEQTEQPPDNDVSIQEKENNNPETESSNKNMLSPQSPTDSKLRKSPMKLFFSKSRQSSTGSSPTTPTKSSPFKPSRLAKTPTSLPVTPKKYFKKSHSASESPTSPVTPDSPFSPPHKSVTSPTTPKRRGKRLLKVYKRTVSYESNV